METKTHSVAVRRSPLRPWPETLQLVSELYEFFGAQGVRKLAATRIRAYRDAFETFKQAADSGARLPRAEAEDVIETMVEFEQLRIIMDAAKKSLRPSAWVSQLKKLAAGPTFATAETAAASPRDTQFECFLGAVAARGGYDITFDEPDIVLHDGTFRFVVAAKRPRSVSSVEKNCRKAARQIAASGLPGVIALDLTHALHAGWCLTPETREDALSIAEESVETFLAAHEPLLKRYVNRRAAAVLVSVHLPAIIGIPTQPQLMTAVAWRFMNISNDLVEITWLAAFAKRCINGLFGPVTPDEPPFAETA